MVKILIFVLVVGCLQYSASKCFETLTRLYFVSYYLDLANSSFVLSFSFSRFRVFRY